MPKNYLLLLFFIGQIYSCQGGWEKQENSPATPPTKVNDGNDELENETPPPSIGRFGRLQEMPLFSNIYQEQSSDSLDFPIINRAFLEVLQRQEELLHFNRGIRNFHIGDLTFNSVDLEKTVKILRSRQHTKPVDLSLLLDAHQIWGEDRKGNVLFTGYYTPVLQVSKTPNEEYRFPIYERPREWSGPLPTRAQIEGSGALEGMDLEIAYSNDKYDIYTMQVQGSGFVEYLTGERELFGYNGTNRHPYRSIEKYMLSREDWEVGNISPQGIRAFFRENPQLVDSVLFHNPSYTFFQARSTLPKGAGNVPLTASYSIAVDRRYIPLGSCLLAAIPIFNNTRTRVVGHEFRYLVAQDVGGRIKGPGHVDLYLGIGKKNRDLSFSIKNYGRLWLLLPKRKASLFSMN